MFSLFAVFDCSTDTGRDEIFLIMLGLSRSIDGGEPIIQRLINKIRRGRLLPCCPIDEGWDEVSRRQVR